MGRYSSPQFLKTLFPLKRLTLLELSQKLAMLLALLTGHWGQSLYILGVTAITCNDDSLIVRFTKVLKTTQPGKHVMEAVLPAYDTDPSLCIVRPYQANIV